MGRYYYYNPNTCKYYNNVSAAVFDDLLGSKNVTKRIQDFGVTEWGCLTNPWWCEEHPAEACDLVGIMKTRTKFKLERTIQKQLYRLLTKQAKH